MVTAIARGLQPSFAWPGTGGSSLASAGDSIPGNLRLPSFTSASSLTGGQGNGFLSLSETHESLHHSGSSWTAMLGHAAMLDHGGGIGNAPFTARWLAQSGAVFVASLTSTGTWNVTFPVPYMGTPFVHIRTRPFGSGYAVYTEVSTATSGGFQSFYTITLGVQGSPLSFVWISDGTVAR